VLRWIAIVMCLLSVSCNATCLRDSDCMGASICTLNRCILIVSGDAGRKTSSPSSDTENPTPDGATAEPSSDAGSVN
jgi:hypothetical protein